MFLQIKQLFEAINQRLGFYNILNTPVSHTPPDFLSSLSHPSRTLLEALENGADI